MTSTALQPIGICVFFAAFVLIAAGLASGSAVLLVVGFLALAFSAVLFSKTKSSEAGE